MGARPGVEVGTKAKWRGQRLGGSETRSGGQDQGRVEGTDDGREVT